MKEGETAIPLIAREPVRGTYPPPELLGLPGVERLRFMIDEPGAPPFVHLSGLRFTDAGLGTATVAMPASPWWQTLAGVFPAGVLGFVADSALAGAVISALPPNTIISTSEISLNFLRPAMSSSGTIIGRGRLIHSTRSLGLSEVFLEDGRGRLLGHGTSRCVMIPIDPETLKGQRGTLEPPAADFQDFWARPVEGLIRDQADWNATSGHQAMLDRMEPGNSPPQVILLGQRVVDVSEREATIAVPASGWFTTASGMIYGGLLAHLADFATALAVAVTVPAGTAFSPLDLKVNFLRPALPGDGEITATATQIHAGRKIAVYAINVRDSAGKLLATANESVLILPGRSWDKPVQVADEAAVED